MVVLAQPLVFRDADPAGKAVGIETRHRRHRQQIDGQAVDDDDRSRFGDDAASGIMLEAGVDGQEERLDLHVGLGRTVAYHADASGYLAPAGWKGRGEGTVLYGRVKP